jgi:hypothetical protein
VGSKIRSDKSKNVGDYLVRKVMMRFLTKIEIEVKYSSWFL